MSCSTCKSSRSPRSKFEELGISIERHGTLYVCKDCGQLLELIAEERSMRYPGLAEAFSYYFELDCWPIRVPRMFCKSCGRIIDLERAINNAPYSWPELSTFWHKCPGCSTGNHLQFKEGKASIVEITGAPGPTWIALSTTCIADVDARADPEFLQVWLGDFHRAIPRRK